LLIKKRNVLARTLLELKGQRKDKIRDEILALWLSMLKTTRKLHECGEDIRFSESRSEMRVQDNPKKSHNVGKRNSLISIGCIHIRAPFAEMATKFPNAPNCHVQQSSLHARQIPL
jgi:hypothetical protein